MDNNIPERGPGSKEDEAKAMLQLLTCFEDYPMATGLSHLMGLLIRDAAKGRGNRNTGPESAEGHK